MTWPYEAPEDDPLTALRIPVSKCSHPDWAYIVAFDGSSPERPTEREALMIKAFLEEYIDNWYSETWKMRLAEHPFDIDGGANGMTFYKWGEDDWGYRQRTWTYGPLYFPGYEMRPYSLEQILDHRHTMVDTVSSRWLDWKAKHPEVFGDESTD